MGTKWFKIRENDFIDREGIEVANLGLYIMHFIIGGEVSIGFQNRKEVNVNFVYFREC